MNIGFWTIVSSKIGVCESIITYEQKASIPLIAMMYILHRQLNGKFLPLADFWCEPRHSQVKIEGRVTHFSVRKWFTGLIFLVYQGVSIMTCFNIIWIGRLGLSIMRIVFSIRFSRLQWCNGYLASLPRWGPRFDSHGRKYFFVFNLIFPIFYIFCNKTLVAFYIKFNALAKRSHQPRFFFFFFFFFFLLLLLLFFFYKFSNPNRIITVMVTVVRLCHFF